MLKKKYYLEADSPLGQKIHITKPYWDYIVEQKHPSISGLEKLVLKTIAAPDTIRASQKDPAVWLFYGKHKSIYVCVAVKILDSIGFIITIYPTDNIKSGEIVWPK